MAVRIFVILVVLSNVANAGPLGTLWRAKHPGTSCPGRIATPNGFIIQERGAITLHDNAGKASKVAVDAALKAPYIEGVVGDSYVVSADKTIAGVDRKTGALRWRRDQDPKVERGFQRAHVAQSDVVLLDVAFEKPIKIAVERLDAATGKSKWKATVPTKRERYDAVLSSAKYVYLVTKDMNPNRYTITAYDAAGKVAWSLDDDGAGQIPEWSTHGDDLIAIANNAVSVYVNGKVSRWKTNHNSEPIFADGVIYATPVSRELEALDPRTGTKRWATKLPADARLPNVKVLGAARNVVYVEDGRQLRSFDTKTGALVASYGIAEAQSPRVHASAPAITLCDAGNVVALDESSTETDHRVSIMARVRCKNCTAATKVEMQVGDTAVTLGADRKLALEVTARGKHELTIRDTESSRAFDVKVISFDADRAVKLGDLRVKVPQPGDDRTYHP